MGWLICCGVAKKVKIIISQNMSQLIGWQLDASTYCFTLSTFNLVSRNGLELWWSLLVHSNSLILHDMIILFLEYLIASIKHDSSWNHSSSSFKAQDISGNTLQNRCIPHRWKIAVMLNNISICVSSMNYMNNIIYVYTLLIWRNGIYFAYFWFSAWALAPCPKIGYGSLNMRSPKQGPRRLSIWLLITPFTRNPSSCSFLRSLDKNSS